MVTIYYKTKNRGRKDFKNKTYYKCEKPFLSPGSDTNQANNVKPIMSSQIELFAAYCMHLSDLTGKPHEINSKISVKRAINFGKFTVKIRVNV